MNIEITYIEEKFDYWFVPHQSLRDGKIVYKLIITTHDELPF